MEVIDTHCHLNDPNLSVSVDQAIANAQKAGVTQFVVPGTDYATSVRATELAAEYPGVCFAAVGSHPHDVLNAATWPSAIALADLRALAARPGVVAIGEIGMDYHHYAPEATRQAQQEAFAAQLGLALELDLPAIVHGRQAYDDVLDVIRAHPGSRGVLHSFEASYEVATAALELGWLVSFTALVTYRGNDALREVVKLLPADAFMLETDTPYLPPQSVRDRAKSEAASPGVIGARGRSNQPAYIVEAAQVVADLRGTSLELLAERTSTTARRFFGL